MIEDASPSKFEFCLCDTIEIRTNEMTLSLYVPVKRWISSLYVGTRNKVYTSKNKITTNKNDGSLVMTSQ
jgi:hypothetical protein